jgi:hypothetical protein
VKEMKGEDLVSACSCQGHVRSACRVGGDPLDTSILQRKEPRLREPGHVSTFKACGLLSVPEEWRCCWCVSACMGASHISIPQKTSSHKVLQTKRPACGKHKGWN